MVMLFTWLQLLLLKRNGTCLKCKESAADQLALKAIKYEETNAKPTALARSIGLTSSGKA